MSIDFPTLLSLVIASEEYQVRRDLHSAIHANNDRLAAFHRGSLHALSRCRQLKDFTELDVEIENVSTHVEMATPFDDHRNQLRNSWFWGWRTQLSVVRSQLQKVQSR